MIIPLNLRIMNMHITPHLFNPHPATIIICHHRLCHIQIRRLLQARSNFQEYFSVDVPVYGEHNIHVVGGGHDALGTGEVLYHDSLD